MYESPIELIYGDMQTKFENDICEVVQEVGINVNKDQLISALIYDRHQYEKGYQDAKKEILAAVLEQAKKSGFSHEIKGEEFFMGRTTVTLLYYSDLEEIVKGLLN